MAYGRSNCVQRRKQRINIMSEKERIFSGVLRFTTDNFLLELDNSQGFIDLSGDGLDVILRRANFEEAPLNHKRISVLGHIGERPLSPDPAVTSKVRSL